MWGGDGSQSPARRAVSGREPQEACLIGLSRLRTEGANWELRAVQLFYLVDKFTGEAAVVIDVCW